ncbi:hypothetical protein HA402_000189 [Bradysia odoriphaga]|nr:hypothetical protein HA402_000189 [Bradysia odoriphaga]
MMENIALVFCSSGTTGVPKGVQITQYNVWFSISDSIIDVEPNECFLSVAPWTHIFGCYSLTRTAVHCRLSVYLPKFEEEKYLKCIETYKVTILVVVPPIMVLLSKTSLLDKYDTSSIKYAVSSAAPLNKETVEAVQKRMPQLLTRQVYGMSEAGTFCVQTDTHCKPGSVGVLRTGVYGKVIDTETGKVLGPNSSGELLFKSAGVMKGYVGDSDATKASFDQDGWLHTGDVGFYDDDGEYFIVDRLKELIKYNAFQVPPAELEALILTHPNVQDVGVIGVPDEAAGELPMAFVVKQGDCTEKDIIDFVASRTSAAKRLRGGVKFIAEIPKNPTGKILRRVLRDLIKTQRSKL